MAREGESGLILKMHALVAGLAMVMCHKIFLILRTMGLHSPDTCTLFDLLKMQLAGMILCSLGIYLKVRDPFQNIKLVYFESTESLAFPLSEVENNREARCPGSNTNVCISFSCSFLTDSAINAFLSVAVVTMVAGALLIVFSIFGVIVARAKSIRIPVLILYSLMALIVIGALVLIAVVMLMLAKGKAPLGIEMALAKAWRNTVAQRKADACRIQKDYKCFGFYDHFCLGCGAFNSSNIRDCSKEQAPLCPICSSTPPKTTKGCYDAIVGYTKNLNIPVGASCSVVAGIVALDALFVCAL